MIRYSRSFSLSLAVHVLSFGLLFAALKEIVPQKEKSEEKICIKLQEVQEIKEATPKIEEPKKVETPPEIKPQKTEPPKQIIQKKTEIPKPKPIEKKRVEVEDEPFIETQKRVEESLPKSDFTSQGSQTDMPKQVVSNQESKVQIRDESQEYIELNAALIAKLIKENLSYPISARRQGIEGIVIIRFNLSSDAKVSNIVVKESSSEILSRSAVKTIEELSQKFPKPSKDIVLSIPINYKLH